MINQKTWIENDDSKSEIIKYSAMLVTQSADFENRWNMFLIIVSIFPKTLIVKIKILKQGKS